MEIADAPQKFCGAISRCDVARATEISGIRRRSRRSWSQSSEDEADVTGVKERFMTCRLSMSLAIVAVALAPAVGIGTTQAHGFGGRGGFHGGGFGGGGFHGGGFSGRGFGGGFDRGFRGGFGRGFYGGYCGCFPGYYGYGYFPYCYYCY